MNTEQVRAVGQGLEEEDGEDEGHRCLQGNRLLMSTTTQLPCIGQEGRQRDSGAEAIDACRIAGREELEEGLVEILV